MIDIIIRKELECDFRKVEILTREAFWNVYVPGCCEHYLAHVLRKHEDFIPELDYVAETKDGKIVGSVMYTKARLVKELTEGNDMSGEKWFYHESPAFDIDRADAERYDEQFEPKKKEFRPSQEEFYIHSHSVMRD